MGVTMKNQKKDEAGVMRNVRTLYQCSACKRQRALQLFPMIYKHGTKINERQIVYILWKCLTETETEVAAEADVDVSTVKGYKKNLFALLFELYVTGIEDYKTGGEYGDIVEVDEALLGRKPTYGHGNVTKLFKIWVLGIILRSRNN